MFTNPLALIALSLLALPIIIHALVRFSGRKMLFPTLRFLRQTESQRLRLIEIKRWPLLVLRLLAMALFVFAISGPTLMKATRARAVLVLIDSSLSINAAAMKEQATSRAREAISSLSAADSAAVAQFDGSAKLLQDFTSDRVALENAIASYSPRFQAADFGAALMWANEKLAAQPGSRELFFISDLQSSNLYLLEPTRLSDVDLKVIRINNERRANARIDSIAVQAAGETLEVNSTALFDDAERTTLEPINLKFNRSGANNSASNALFSATMLGDDLLAGAVRTNRADDFDADDVRFFVARLAGAEKVMIVQPRFASTDQATFIEKAIQANSP
ncbi:MAG TPA: BatA domain-containing protein, partial [Blastocatellia bacterium]|nr:BatA domain-containing protein [Blastocatellia bacterium]